MYQIGWFYKNGGSFHDEFNYPNLGDAMLGMCHAGLCKEMVRGAYVMDAETGEIVAELEMHL